MTDASRPVERQNPAAGHAPPDETHMRSALSLARRGLGQTHPNPTVGCILVKHGRVIARAHTAPGGRPHAETQALAQAGAAARGATAYVTLEPCAHHGRTPPCADALIAAGIARVVIAASDPDPRTDGAGIARLRAAGVDTHFGILQAEADQLQAGFLTRLRHGRPLVTLKLATTLDGRLATATGESQWITGPAARRAAHALRGTHDATMAGIGTVLADDPALTCRIEGYRRTPDLRIVVDTGLRTPPDSTLVRTAGQAPLWILHAEGATGPALQRTGIRLIPVPGSSDGIDPAAALQALGREGLTRVLVEGGARLAAALLRADLVDRLAWFHAPALLGADATPATGPLHLAALAHMPRFRRTAARALGPDLLTEYDRETAP